MNRVTDMLLHHGCILARGDDTIKVSEKMVCTVTNGTIAVLSNMEETIVDSMVDEAISNQGYLLVQPIDIGYKVVSMEQKYTCTTKI